MSTLVNESLTLAEREQDEESDWAPARERSTVWWRCRGGVWTRHEHRDRPIAEMTGRRLRGDQSYPGLHLGRGTKWIGR